MRGAPEATIGTLRLVVLMWFATLAMAPAHAEYVVAPDVVVFCEPTLQPTLTALAATWRRQTGIPIRLFPSPTPSMLEQLARRPRSDLIVGEGSAAADAAIARKLIKPETRFALWRGRLVVAAIDAKAASSSAPPPSAMTLAASAGKVPIALVDPSAASAGAESRKALVALGLWDAVQRLEIGVADTADASSLLAEGKVRLALIYATDVAANPTFSIIDKLPDDSYGPVVYWVAETNNVLSPNAEKFEAFLRQADVKMPKDGLEVSP
jgi:molybdate transport system substrate-binding protein